MESSKIGIIAGGGLLPQIIIKDLEKNNIEFSIICFEDFLF